MGGLRLLGPGVGVVRGLAEEPEHAVVVLVRRGAAELAQEPAHGAVHSAELRPYADAGPQHPTSVPVLKDLIRIRGTTGCSMCSPLHLAVYGTTSGRAGASDDGGLVSLHVDVVLSRIGRVRNGRPGGVCEVRAPFMCLRFASWRGRISPYAALVDAPWPYGLEAPNVPMADAGISPRQLAMRVGVSGKTVERWIGDDGLIPYAGKREDAAAALGVEAEMLFRCGVG